VAKNVRTGRPGRERTADECSGRFGTPTRGIAIRDTDEGERGRDRQRRKKTSREVRPNGDLVSVNLPGLPYFRPSRLPGLNEN